VESEVARVSRGAELLDVADKIAMSGGVEGWERGQGVGCLAHEDADGGELRFGDRLGYKDGKECLVSLLGKASTKATSMRKGGPGKVLELDEGDPRREETGNESRCGKDELHGGLRDAVLTKTVGENVEARGKGLIGVTRRAEVRACPCGRGGDSERLEKGRRPREQGTELGLNPREGLQEETMDGVKMGSGAQEGTLAQRKPEGRQEGVEVRRDPRSARWQEVS